MKFDKLKEDTLNFLNLLKSEEQSDLDCCNIQYGSDYDEDTKDDLSWKRKRIEQLEYAINCIYKVSQIK